MAIDPPAGDLSERWEKGIHDGESTDDIDSEFVPASRFGYIVARFIASC
jgi:hypothetical protein